MFTLFSVQDVQKPRLIAISAQGGAPCNVSQVLLPLVWQNSQAMPKLYSIVRQQYLE
ncbi:unannotated protein [freshwater metagenome]|uniref:Unannotated protein n=1 Tax=freshwater metagenome TaxID=449393 RepID=A0A6J6XGZ3_9ZZZZ